MNNSCKKIEPLIALAVSDDLTLDERRLVDRHIATCVGCARLHEELRTFQCNLDDLKSLSGSETFPEFIDTSSTSSWVHYPLGVIGSVALSATLLLSFANLQRPEAPSRPVEIAHNTTKDSHSFSKEVDFVLPEPIIVESTRTRGYFGKLPQENDVATTILARIATEDPNVVILWMGND